MARAVDLGEGEEPQHKFMMELSRAKLKAWPEWAVCVATPKAVEESSEDQLKRLAPLPLLPVPFDIAVTQPVQGGCLTRFEYHPDAVRRWVTPRPSQTQSRFHVAPPALPHQRVILRAEGPLLAPR